jgi:hypothetical protein
MAHLQVKEGTVHNELPALLTGGRGCGIDSIDISLFSFHMFLVICLPAYISFRFLVVFSLINQSY